MKDRLTRRERIVYKTLHALGLAAAALGLMVFVVLDWQEPTHAVTVLFAFVCLLVPIFGYALRTDTRIIHGSRWLRKE